MSGKNHKKAGVNQKLRVTDQAREGLNWWRTHVNLIHGAQIRPRQPDLEITTDASNHGWGGHCGSQAFHGDWSQEEDGLHINILEIWAVYMTLVRLQPQVGSTVLVNKDNTTVMAYIIRQGG